MVISLPFVFSALLKPDLDCLGWKWSKLSLWLMDLGLFDEKDHTERHSQCAA